MTARREAGAALVLALLAVTAVAAAVLVVAGLIDARRVASGYEYRTVVLTTLSDAALAETLARLSEDPDHAGIDERRFGEGGIASSVGTTPAGTRLVTAVGSFAGWRSVLVAEVRLEDGGPRVLGFERHAVPDRGRSDLSTVIGG